MGISRSQFQVMAAVAAAVSVLAVGVGGRLWTHHSQLNRFDMIVTALKDNGENGVFEGKEVFVCSNIDGTGGIATDRVYIYLKTPEREVKAAKTEDPLLNPLSAI